MLYGLQAGALQDRAVLRRPLGNQALPAASRRADAAILASLRAATAWVPEVCEKQIDCVKYVRETCVRRCPTRFAA